MTTNDFTSRPPGPRPARDLLRNLPMPSVPATAKPVTPADAPCMSAEEDADWNRERAHAWYTRNTPPRFHHAIADHPQVTDWVTRYLLDPALAGSLALFGHTGVGKSHQAYGAFALIGQSGRRPVKWVAAAEPDLYARLRPGSGLASEAEFTRVADAPLLLIDDLGAARDTDWTEEVMFRLINRRYNQCLPTLFTTNVPLEQLKKAMGDRVNSRLRQMCIKVEMGGTDRREAP